VDEEEFLGGFTSVNLMRSINGYGIYATDKRIIGVKSRKDELIGILVAGIINAALGILFFILFAYKLEEIGGIIGGAIIVIICSVMGNILGLVVRIELGEKLTKYENSKTIEELDRKKDLEITREEIFQIEIKKPRFLIAGDLKIKLTSGGEVRIGIYGEKVFELVRDLMRSFLPEKLYVVG